MDDELEVNVTEGHEDAVETELTSLIRAYVVVGKEIRDSLLTDPIDVKRLIKVINTLADAEGLFLHVLSEHTDITPEVFDALVMPSQPVPTKNYTHEGDDPILNPERMKKAGDN